MSFTSPYGNLFYLATNYKLQTTNYKLQTINYKLQTINYKLINISLLIHQNLCYIFQIFYINELD